MMSTNSVILTFRWVFMRYRKIPQPKTNLEHQFVVLFLTSALRLILSDTTNPGTLIHNQILQNSFSQSPYAVDPPYFRSEN